MGRHKFVSPDGSDTNPGTKTKPFQHVQRGIDELSDPDDLLTLRDGRYVGSIQVQGINGTAKHPIRIRAANGEQATIDAGFDEADSAAAGFGQPGSGAWQLVDPVIGEYVSTEGFEFHPSDKMNRGAFSDVTPYTRLITYSQLQDLQAQNQQFGPTLEGSGLAGPFVVDDQGQFIFHGDKREMRPWVYMGPGIFHAPDGKVHIRLAHTSNNLAGLADYAGATDPNKVPLAISRERSATIEVSDCSHVEFGNLTVRFGGRTIHILRCTGIRFDHVDIFAGVRGVEMGLNNQNGSSDTEFGHCAFHGGIPTWYFRSDRKTKYLFLTGGSRTTNVLGAQTASELVAGSVGQTVNTEIHHCEFTNGHDLQLVGTEFRFHHNWIHNMQDDALVLDVGTTNGEIAHNVISQCMTVFSYAGNKISGPHSIHHNLIDMRTPIAGRRPRPNHAIGDGVPPMRYGQFYKSNGSDGPLEIFHNTCLVRFQEGEASFQHYGNDPDAALPPELDGIRRQAYNNIFVDIDPRPLQQFRATAMLPILPRYIGPSDGNYFVQIGPFFDTQARDQTGVLWHRKCHPAGGDVDRTTYANLEEYRHTVPAPGKLQYLAASQANYPPGYEASSITGEPPFRRFDPTGDPHPDDDLRLHLGSPARNGGIRLNELNPPINDPLTPAQSRPHMGCYVTGASRLTVGVDGRRQFPASG